MKVENGFPIEADQELSAQCTSSGANRSQHLARDDACLPIRPSLLKHGLRGALLSRSLYRTPAGNGTCLPIALVDRLPQNRP